MVNSKSDSSASASASASASTPDLARRPRTKRTFSEADMARMRDLYYDRDIPLTKVADSFAVPVSTFLRWIAEMDWPRRSAWNPPAPPPQPSPAARERGQATRGAEEPFNAERLAVEVAAAARVELAQLGDVSGPMTLDERKRRADIIASLSRSIARIDRTFEARVERERLKAAVKNARAKSPIDDEIAELQKLVAASALNVARRMGRGG